jgi:hypothetical protein
VAGEQAGGLVVAEHRHVEAPDAGAPCPVDECRHQFGANPLVLPAVDDLDRHLGGVECLEPHVAGDPDRRPGRRREGDQRLVVPMVDVDQVGELAGRQLGLGGEEALVARPRAEVGKRERHRGSIRRQQLANRNHQAA